MKNPTCIISLLLVSCGGIAVVDPDDSTSSSTSSSSTTATTGSTTTTVTTTTSTATTTAPAPVLCDSDFACPEGQICVGEGCDEPWVCQPGDHVDCPAELVIACGCNGLALKISSGCPWASFGHEGYCDPTACTSTLGGCCAEDAQCPTGGSCEQGFCVKGAP